MAWTAAAFSCWPPIAQLPCSTSTILWDPGHPAQFLAFDLDHGFGHFFDQLLLLGGAEDVTWSCRHSPASEFFFVGVENYRCHAAVAASSANEAMHYSFCSKLPGSTYMGGQGAGSWNYGRLLIAKATIDIGRALERPDRPGAVDGRDGVQRIAAGPGRISPALLDRAPRSLSRPKDWWSGAGLTGSAATNIIRHRPARRFCRWSLPWAEWGLCWASDKLTQDDLDVEFLMFYLERSIDPAQLPATTAWHPVQVQGSLGPGQSAAAGRRREGRRVHQPARARRGCLSHDHDAHHA